MESLNGEGESSVQYASKSVGMLRLGLDSPSSWTLRRFFANKVPWRARIISLALIVGLLCGMVAVLYDTVLEFVLECVWAQGGPAFARLLPMLPPWMYILVVCIPLGGLVGVLIHLLGEPMANLPGVVMAAHRDGLLGHEEAPAMAIISLTSITAAGSLGPEAPLVSIGGGLASFVSCYVDLSEAETLFVTMCGMGAGLAAFFGEPVGGAIFACEVIHRHGLEYYEAVVPCVVAGLACNWSFRVIANLPQKPICARHVDPMRAHLSMSDLAPEPCSLSDDARLRQGPLLLRRLSCLGPPSSGSCTAWSAVCSGGHGCAAPT